MYRQKKLFGESEDDEIRCPKCACPMHEVLTSQNHWNRWQSLLRCLNPLCYHAWLRTSEPVDPPIYYEIACPYCRSTSSQVYTVLKSRKRYHKCNDCKMPFISLPE